MKIYCQDVRIYYIRTGTGITENDEAKLCTYRDTRRPRLHLTKGKGIECHMIPHDMICYFNVRSKADMSQIDLPHETNNEKVEKTRKTILGSIGKQSGESVESVPKKTRKATVGRTHINHINIYCQNVMIISHVIIVIIIVTVVIFIRSDVRRNME